MQRLELARALVRDPKVLFVDEPLANLDPGKAESIVKLLADIKSSNSEMTIVCITHHSEKFEDVGFDTRKVDMSDLQRSRVVDGQKTFQTGSRLLRE